MFKRILHCRVQDWPGFGLDHNSLNPKPHHEQTPQSLDLLNPEPRTPNPLEHPYRAFEKGPLREPVHSEYQGIQPYKSLPQLYKSLYFYPFSPFIYIYTHTHVWTCIYVHTYMHMCLCMYISIAVSLRRLHDPGALRTAHAGLALSEAEASMASRAKSSFSGSRQEFR